jgi:hypothetical protein
VLDAVGTAGGSTAFIVITDDDIVTQVLSLVLLTYNHSVKPENVFEA